MEEILELFDKDGMPIGKTIIRKAKPEPGEYIKLVLAFIENSKNQFLVQKTSKEKGGEFAFTGGHVKTGQSCEEACVCELKEELGVLAMQKDLKFIGKFSHKDAALFYVYHIFKDISAKDIKLQKNEVEDILWLYKSEIEELIKEESFRETSALAYNILNQVEIR